MKLHLGCGKRNFGPDWIHIDGGDFDHLHSHDIVNLPFEAGTIDLIYSSHTLEYFSRDEVNSVLETWKTILKVGGILRLAVPDFHAMAKLYIEKGCTLDQITGPIYGLWNMDGKTVQHKTAYDFTSLEKVLKTAGFSDIHRYDWRLTEHAKFDDHSQAYLPHMDKENGTLISLNIECRKQ